MKYPALANVMQQLISKYGSKEEVARRLRTNGTSIAQWAAGNRMPVYSMLAHIAHLAGTTVDQIASQGANA